MNFRLSLAGRGVNTIRLFVMACFIFGIIALIQRCTTTQQPPSAKSFTTEHRASANTKLSAAPNATVSHPRKADTKQTGIAAEGFISRIRMATCLSS